MAAIQAAILDGELNENCVEVVTDDCSEDLARLGWSYTDLLAFLRALVPYRLSGQHDFKNAQWCLGSGTEVWYPCDAYAAPFDPIGKRRTPRGSTVYVKFSIPEDGKCLLIAVSTHN